MTIKEMVPIPSPGEQVTGEHTATAAERGDAETAAGKAEACGSRRKRFQQVKS